LNEALSLAEPGGFLRLFMDEGPVMRKLVAEAHGQGRYAGYTERILAAFSEASGKTAGQVPLEKAQKSQELLTERELEVLVLMAEGLSNQGIAERLFISVLTEKVHVHNISTKLGTPSRTAAVAKARSLGLLQ
jgi:LuxR family maltose regulon positive regulatory protein